ncbi:MAG TPA: HAD family hydrolase [Rhizomicrobium sp.]|jgi:4-nitrophenyl phosphatase
MHSFSDTSHTLRAARQRIADAKGLLLDWDGCVALDNKLRADAIRFIAARQDRVAIVSNNSTHMPQDFAAILDGAGIHIPVERIILAGTQAIARARQHGLHKLLVIGDSRMKAYAHGQGLTLVEKSPEAVLLMRDRHFSYAKLKRAANALRDGAKLLVANGDRVHPGSMGEIVPETGALLAGLLACVPASSVEFEIIGKPAPLLFQQACRALNVDPGDAVMIGDNPDTDIAGALAQGLHAVQVEGQSELRIADLLHTDHPA